MPRTSSMTYADFKKRVALRAELVTQEAGTRKKVARTDEPTVSRLEDAIADGVREFMRSHQWSWATFMCYLTLSANGASAHNIDGNASRYLLPRHVESLPMGRIKFIGPDNAPGGEIKQRHMDDVVGMMFRDPSSTGSPEMYAAEWNPSLASGLSDNGGIELAIWPKVDQDYRIAFRARLGCPAFVADHQVGIWPALHDLTVVDFAVVELFEEDKDKGDPDQTRAYAAAVAKRDRSLAISIARDDEEFRPQELGAAGESDMPRGRLFQGYDVDGSLLVSATLYD